MVHEFQQRRSKSTDALPSYSTQETVIHVYSRGNGCFVLIRLCTMGPKQGGWNRGYSLSRLHCQSKVEGSVAWAWASRGLQWPVLISRAIRWEHILLNNLSTPVHIAGTYNTHFPSSPSWLGVSGPLRTLHIRSRWCFALRITVIFCTSNYNGVFRIKLHWSLLK